MKAVFIVTSYWAYGELLIALHFARKMHDAGASSYFFIPSTHVRIVKQEGFPYSVMIPHCRKINCMLMQDIEDCYHPALVILADFLNYCFCEQHYELRVEDLAIFTGRLGTFDNFDWEQTGRQMDTYGYKAQRFGEIQIEQFGFRLMPVPIIQPARGSPQDNRYTYLLDGNKLPYDELRTAARRQELGLPSDHKMILITSAIWQETYKLYPQVVRFVAAANWAFKNILLSLAEDYTILYVGPRGFLEQEHLPESFIFRPQLDPEEFDQYVLAADAYLSRNITSTTLARIALSGVPAVVFKNSLFFTHETFPGFTFPFHITDATHDLLSKLEMCYPFRMFPVGWFKFLKPVIAGNPYRKILIETEQFDLQGSIEKISHILESKQTREQLVTQRELYCHIVEKLPPVQDILLDVAKS